MSMTQENPERIREALSFIPPDPRDDWVQMGMAVKNALGDNGFEIWDGWSRNGPTYNERDALDVWKSIKTNGNGKSITASSLYKRAMDNGWKPPRIGHQAPNSEQTEQARKDREEHERQAQAQRKADQEAAASKAARILNESTPATDHPYLARKGIKAVGRVRQFMEALVVPMSTTDGELHNLQFINADGTKRFLSGGRVSGCYFPIGRPDGAVCVCEGLATGESIHQATGYGVAVAFNNVNLLPVAQALHEKYPDIQLIVCADDDVTPGNPGLTKARAAALAVNGLLAVPDFGEDRPEGMTDFNDLAAHRGPEAINESLKSADYVKNTGDGGDTGDNVDITDDSASPVGQNEPGTTGDKLPKGYRMADSGVWYTPDEEGATDQWVCSTLHITAATRDNDGNEWGRLLEFKDPDGRPKQWACPMEMMAGGGEDFRRVLLSMGLLIAPGNKSRQLLAQYVQTANTGTRAICTNRTGWRGPVYVLPDETIHPDGDDQGERVLLQTLGEPPRMKQAGTAEEWRDHIGRLCSGNSRLVLAVSAAFSAPLLKITGDESGGIHFVGMSSTGKTTALRIAASVWGGPEYLHRWRATANGLEAIAQSHNDAPLILDELSQVDPKEAGETAYMLANGTGKHRAKRDGLAKPAATWRLLFLSAGEVGLSDHMREAGKRSRAGQEVRMVDIPTESQFGLFDELHGHKDGAALSIALHEAVSKYHGTTARAYLKALVNVPAETLCQQVKALCSDFIDEVVPDGANGQARRVAQRFALIAAGGEIASRLGLTGWDQDEAKRGAHECFNAWLERRGGTGAQEIDTALAQVKHFIEAHGEARFTDFDHQNDRPTINRAGYRRVMDGRIQYLILPQVFRQEVCRGFDYKLVARALKDRELLVAESYDHLTIKPRGMSRVFCVLEADE